MLTNLIFILSKIRWMDGYIDKILTSFVETVMNFDVFQESFIFYFYFDHLL